MLDAGNGRSFIICDMQTGYHMKPRQMRALVLLLVLLPLFPTALVLRFVMDASADEQEVFETRIGELYDKHLRTVTSYQRDKMAAELEGLPEMTSKATNLVELIRGFRLDALLVYDSTNALAGPPTSTAKIPLQQELQSLYPDGSAFLDWEPGVWRRLGEPVEVYGCMVLMPDGIAMAIREDTTLSVSVRDFYQSSMGPEVRIAVATNTAQLLTVMTSAREPVLSTVALGNSLPGWTVSLSLDADTAGQMGLRKQGLSYRWLAAGMLVITLSISSLAGWTVTRQIRLNEIRNTALAALAHELKTPLASSRLLLETLLDGRMPSPSGQREYHEMLARENQRLTRIVTNFLQLARMEQPDYRPRKEPGNIDELVASVVEPIQVRAAADGSEVIIQIQPEIPAIPLDHNTVSSALGNLLDNALKFSPSGAPVQLDVEFKDGWLSFAVTDEGPGIDPALRKEIFKPFRQADERLSRQGEGCGLGLSIVRSVVKSHDGKILISDRAGGGSVFTFLLPVPRSISPAKTPAPALQTLS